jgi:hypothetical protein
MFWLMLIEESVYGMRNTVTQYRLCIDKKSKCFHLCVCFTQVVIFHVLIMFIHCQTVALIMVNLHQMPISESTFILSSSKTFFTLSKPQKKIYPNTSSNLRNCSSTNEWQMNILYIEIGIYSPNCL